MPAAPRSDLPASHLHEQARSAILANQSASVAMLQRALRLGYREAVALMTQFEGELVSEPGPDSWRRILPGLLDLTHRPHPLNSYWVVPGSLMAGEYPGHPDQTEARRKLAGLLAHGLDALLDLTEADELTPYAELLAELARASGVDHRYRRMPIRELDIPREPRQMRDILKQIQQWRQEGRTVYVHCWGGVGRTGTVMGCHLVEDGMSGTAALDHIALLWTRMSEDKRRRHPISPETAAQRRYVHDWAQWLEGDDAAP